jgi:hypothetical protein
MKKTVKNTKPSYTVDLTKVKTLEDIDVAFGLAKQKAGLAISDEELSAIVFDAIKAFGPRITIVDCTCPKAAKKPNIFKRFWNWMLGRK